MLLLQVRYEIFATEEKNRLWKLVLKKVSVYRSQDYELSIHLYPTCRNSRILCTLAGPHKSTFSLKIHKNLSTIAP